MKIGVVRHGQPFKIRLERGGLNPSLTPTGKQQVKELGKSGKLAKFKWMFASPALRALNTALILSDYTGLTPITLADLSFVRIDRKILGDLATAVQNTEFHKWPTLWIKTRWGGLETPEAFMERIRLALREITCLCKGDDVLIIAHKEVFWAIVAIVKNIPIEEAIEKEDIGHAELRVLEFKGNI